MTLQEIANDDPADASAASDEPQARSERRRQAARRQRRTGIVYACAVVLLAGLIPVLGYVGVRTILDSSDGEVVDPVLDPTEPGYRALIQPSPTMLLIHENAEGAMVGGAVLSMGSTDGGGGSVILYPPSLIAEIPEIGDLAISVANDFNGEEAALAAAEWTLHVDLPEVVAMSDEQLAEMYTATGPLTIQNPDTITLADGTTFPAGSLVLEPAEIPRYSGYLGADESPLNRLLRQQLVWEAWIDQIEADATVSFPGEQDSGLARFLNGITDGTNRIENLPLSTDVDPESPGLRLDEERWAELIPDLIPFPAGAAEGDRFVVRVLAGTEDTAAVRAGARRAIAAGGQVNMVGNADQFGQQETEIIYYDASMRSSAEAVAESLGFGTVTRVDEIDDTADVIVVLGADADL